MAIKRCRSCVFCSQCAGMVGCKSLMQSHHAKLFLCDMGKKQLLMLVVLYSFCQYVSKREQMFAKHQANRCLCNLENPTDVKIWLI